VNTIDLVIDHLGIDEQQGIAYRRRNKIDIANDLVGRLGSGIQIIDYPVGVAIHQPHARIRQNADKQRDQQNGHECHGQTGPNLHIVEHHFLLCGTKGY
jgi:hypothetical protein